MEEKVFTRVPPEKIWEAWERAHNGRLVDRAKGKSEGKSGSKFKYEIFDVVPGERFSVLWKTLFVRLVFTHAVAKSGRGSEIRYCVKIRGLFALPVRWLLGNKIRRNVALVLKALVRRLEESAG